MNNPNSHNLKPRTSVVFWGTPEFALPALAALFKNGYDIMAVITNPDKPVGRKQLLTSPPTKVWAEKHKIPVFQPNSLEIGNWKLEIPHADIYIIASYGKIIPKEILNLPRFGAVNIHPSILPCWRGPSPIQYTILNGDMKTGVTIMKTDERMDHGPILAQQEFPISPPEARLAKSGKSQISKLTYKELHNELAKLGAELLMDTLLKWIAGEITPIPQNDAKATYSKILKKDDGRINWKKPAGEIERMVRAFNPWPGTWTLWPTNKKIMRLRIESAEFDDSESLEGSPGFIWQKPDGGICVKTGHGSLVLKEITPSGKKVMSANAFCLGYKNFIGSNLI
ncbi:MAG: methionyl-tRNA formyltransferase [Candidatus Sungbacteria bacterium]|nr:methionyl-tRNA formyltransferase [Candidatus Sungbacteria bacterium]